MSKNKKPTMMQVKNVINNLIREIGMAQQGISQLDYLLNYYIKFNKDEDKFAKFLESISIKENKKQKEQNEKRKEVNPTK